MEIDREVAISYTISRDAAHLAAVDEAEAGRRAAVDQPCHACLFPPMRPGRRNHRSPGRRLIAGRNDSVKRSLTADIMARAREIVFVMGREDNSPLRVRCVVVRPCRMRTSPASARALNMCRMVPGFSPWSWARSGTAASRDIAALQGLCAREPGTFSP